jgi:gas vesicle protein
MSFESKIDQLFARKKRQAAALKETVEETTAELKNIPFNVSTVLRQIEEENERRRKTLKRNAHTEYKREEDDN